MTCREQPTPSPPLETTLAAVLRHGTSFATSVIAIGLVAPWFVSSGAAGSMPLVKAGLLLFILLPSLRVTLMIVAFLRCRDYRFASVAACVLAIIVLGFVFGSHLHV